MPLTYYRKSRGINTVWFYTVVRYAWLRVHKCIIFPVNHD